MQTTLQPTPTPEQLQQIQLLKKAGLRLPSSLVETTKVAKLSVQDFGRRYFYIPETGRPIEPEIWQSIFLDIASGTHHYSNLLPFYSTILFSSVKKTGKTALSGLYARHKAEQTTLRDEVLFFANDETQSRGRGYAAVQKSIELDPRFDVQKRILYSINGDALWRVIEDYLEHIPTGTKIKAVNVDYRGEAGSNPSLTCWTEAWGYDTEKQFKLFDEMTPVLTRYHSQRYLESYAGYTGKSIILEKVWNMAVKDGRQLTIDDIPDWPWPQEQLLPFYVNDDAGLFAYIDQGPIARTRMPWTNENHPQYGAEAKRYYAEQAHTLPPEQFDRLHNNYWVTPIDAFIPIVWWDQTQNTQLQPLTTTEQKQQTPMVLAVDASVTGDCTAVVGVTRNPESNKYQDVVLRLAIKWDPPKGGKLDYENTPNSLTEESLKTLLLRLCAEYNVVEIAYDEWQLHHLMTELKNEGVAWCRPFSQATARDVADKQLYDLIKTRRISHNPTDSNIMNTAMREHLQNAARKVRPNEDTKMHIIKAAADKKIDLVVALSMAAAECLRLDL